MAAEDSRKGLSDAYHKAVESKDALYKKQNELKERVAEQLNAAKAEQDRVQQANKDAAADLILADRAAERSKNSAEAFKEFDDRLIALKGSATKGYDRFDTAMLEIAGLFLAMSTEFGAELSVLLGPEFDKVFDNVSELGIFVAKLPVTGTAYVAVMAASKLSELFEKYDLPPELLAISPIDMVSVTKSGELKFKFFKDDPSLANSGIPPELLRVADTANQTHVIFLVKKAGYEYNSDTGFYMKDGDKLDRKNLVEIVSSSNLTKLLAETLKNKPELELEPEQKPEPAPSPRMR